jgi:hypothetical protein
MKERQEERKKGKRKKNSHGDDEKDKGLLAKK